MLSGNQPAALERIESTRTSFHRCSVLACKLPCFSPSAVNLFSRKEGIQPKRVEYCIESNHWFFRLPRPLIHGSLAHTTVFRLQLTRTPCCPCFMLAYMLPCYTPSAVNPFSSKGRRSTEHYRIPYRTESLILRRLHRTTYSWTTGPHNLVRTRPATERRQLAACWLVRLV